MNCKENTISKEPVENKMNQICIVIIDSGVDTSGVNDKEKIEGFSYCNGLLLISLPNNKHNHPYIPLPPQPFSNLRKIGIKMRGKKTNSSHAS